MDTVKLTIDGHEVNAPKGTNVVEAAKLAGIEIPTLCYHPDLDVRANCRVCMVEVEGSRTLQAACAQPVAEGMKVRTNTPLAREARQDVRGTPAGESPAGLPELRAESELRSAALGGTDSAFGRTVLP